MTTNPALAPASAETTTPFHARNRWRWFGWGLAALAVIWVIVDGKNEIGRWYFAAAEVEFARQHDDLADAYLQRAIAWAPNNYQPYLFRGTTKLAEKDYAGALEDLDRALELGGGRYEILTYHSPALQHMGRHEDAVADWRRI
jgi:tetratricopeptide (TPR) repeat protein